MIKENNEFYTGFTKYELPNVSWTLDRAEFDDNGKNIILDYLSGIATIPGNSISGTINVNELNGDTDLAYKIYKNYSETLKYLNFEFEEDIEIYNIKVANYLNNKVVW
jgi:hypothetical protein